MALAAPASFGAQLKALRESAGFTQEELATIAGLSVHAVSALERGDAFTLREVPGLLKARKRDPWAGIDAVEQDLSRWDG